MTFDDVNVPAVLFVCVSMAVALVGNSLVLLVFGFRWRTTNDTKIYIMALAILDLACAIVSFPRDLITLLPESQCLVRKSDMHVYCKLSVFLTHYLNVTSALILVAIAASRYVKVSKGDTDSSKLQEPGPCSAFLAGVRQRFYAIKTVRGAKISIAVATCLAVINGSPALVLFGSGVPEEARFVHTFRNGTFQNATAELVSDSNFEEKNYFCHSACRDDIRGDLKVFRKAFDMFQFVVFVILTLVLMGIYGAVLQKLCSRKENKMCCSGGSEQPDKSASYHDEPTVSSVAHFQSDNDDDCFEDQSVRPLTTTTTTTTENRPERGERKETVSCVSVHLLTENAAIGEGDKRAPARRARSNSDSVQFRNDSHELSLFPPLSYSSENWSEVSLNRQTSQTRDGQSQSNRLSTTSFQLTRTGNQARMTTLVFLLVTLIYIVSYCPYFVVILSLNAAGDAEPGGLWGPSGHVWMEVCRRSYLIANAANPLVYGLCNPYFREQLGKLLICRRDII